MRLSVGAKLLVFFITVILALVLGSFTVVHRQVEDNLNEVLTGQLSENLEVFRQFEKFNLKQVEGNAKLAAGQPELRGILNVGEEVSAKDIHSVVSSFHEKLGVTELWVFRRMVRGGKKSLVYPESLADRADLLELPAVRSALGDEPGPGRQVIPYKGSLYLVATAPVIHLNPADGERDHVGAVLIAHDLRPLTEDLREIAGGDAHVALASGTEVLSTTVGGDEKLRDGLVSGLGRHGDALRRVQRGERIQLTLTLRGERHVALVEPIHRAEGEEESAGTLTIVRSLDAALARQMRKIQAGLLLTAIVAILITMIINILFTRTLTRPIARLETGMQQVAAGELETSVEVTTRDEIGRLTASFNTMVIGLRQKEMFKKMVSDSAARHVEESGRTRKRLRLGGQVETVTIQFTDIRNFTPLTEKLGPEIVELLNGYFTVVADVIARNDGDIDKFIGDAVMITFRDSDESSGALNSVRCAVELQAELPAFNAASRERGWPEIKIGSGIATGDVVAGSVGTAERMQVTVLGDTVNIAARLEAESKVSEHLPIMLDEATYERVADRVEARKIDAQLKGKSGPLSIYEVTAFNDPPDS